MINPKDIFSWTRDPFENNEFEKVALDYFRYQAQHCEVYGRYLKLLGTQAEGVTGLTQIPFMPIEFFKTQRVISAPCDTKIQTVFSSSGTTGSTTSKHEITDLSLYEMSYRQGFSHFYGDPSEWAILALLPSYQEREGSSLIYMVDDLIGLSEHPSSGYFLHDHERLFKTLEDLRNENVKTLLIGVTYALLDFAENFAIENFSNLVVMETGGMKGRRKEMIRDEVHTILKQGFGKSAIHSEYGMTELLSQAYSSGGGMFSCPPWMQVLIRDTNDPLTLVDTGKTGGINVIDLANFNSCSFIATQDLGRIYRDGSFEVLGRFDHSDIRGCNLLVF